jgi:4-amino-4-deoxy-L-arabinose transferase-like glycosyltransferase
MPSGSKYFWAAILLLLPVLIAGQDHGLWARSEAREVEIAREMYVSGNWAVPKLNDKAFLEKPPLMPAVTALAFYLGGGVSERLARVPSTLLALLAAVGVMLIARRMGGNRLGWWSGLILCSAQIFFLYSHQSSVDILLAVCVTFTMLFFFRAYEPGKPSYSFRSVLPIYLCATLAFYAKGFIGVVFPTLAIVFFLIWMRDWRAMWRLKPWFGLLIFLALTAPWFGELWRQGQEKYLKIFFIDNHLYRFFKTAESHLGHQHDPWYWYLVHIWNHFSPWSILGPFAAVGLVRKLRAHDPSAIEIKKLMSWFGAGFLFLTISSTKRDVYLLPILPPFAIMVAMWIDQRIRSYGGPKWEQLSDWGLGLALALAALGYPIWLTLQESGSRYALGFIPAILLPAAAGLYFLVKKNHPRFYSLAWFGIWALFLCSSIFFIPVFSAGEDHSPFARQLNELTRDARIFYSPRVREKECGYIGFYTGKYTRNLKKEKDLAALARSVEPIYVVMMNSDPEEVRQFEEETAKHGVALKLMLEAPGEYGGALWRMTPIPAAGGETP